MHNTLRPGGVTVVELLVALAIMALVSAAMVPLFAGIRNSWNCRQAGVEVLENGRALMEHLNRHLSQAVRILHVSAAAQKNGYLEYEDGNGNDLRYEMGSNNYVQFGPAGNLSDLAGPVSEFKLTCYDACDTGTPTTDVSLVRLVKVEATVTSPAPLGRSRTYTTSIYLRTNGQDTIGLLGWWKLDETSGLTATDSSRFGRDGALMHMFGNEWTTGQIRGALALTGPTELVQMTGLSDHLDTTYTIAWWARPDATQTAENILLGADDTDHDFEYYQYNTALHVRARAGSNDDITVSDVFSPGRWVHLCGVGDASGTRVYVDGVLAGSTVAKKSVTAGYDLNIGAWATGQNGFTGIVDDIRLYNRVLSDSEIAQLANVLRYRGFSEAKAGSLTTSITIPTPYVNAGDLLIAAVAADRDTSASMTAPPGQGWTLIDRGCYGGAITLAAWWKLADASEAASHRFTWSWNSSQGPWPGQAYGWMMRFSGHDATNPINTYATSGESGVAPVSPAVTTTVPDCLILRLGAFDDDGILVDDPGLSGHTAITMDKSADSSGCVVYQSCAEGVTSSDGSSITVPRPVGTARGDFLVAEICTDGSTSGSMAAPGGQGWSSLTVTGPPNWGVTLGIWYRHAGASEPDNYQFTWSGSQEAYGLMMRFSGSGASVVGFAPSWSTSKTPTCSSVTTSGPFGGQMLILRLGGFDEDSISGSHTQLSGETVIRTGKSSSNPGACSGGAGYTIVPAGTPSGSNNFRLTASEAFQTASIPIWSGTYFGTVSGGAGYVKQSAKGSSGTSTFALTASNEARMLTVAIAPGLGNEGTGGYEVRP